MRIWHYQLLPFLPDSLIKQLWADLQDIYKGKRDIYTKFIDVEDRLSLLNYSMRVCIVLRDRNIVPYMESRAIIAAEFGDELRTTTTQSATVSPYANYHDFYYLMYCGSILNELFSLGLPDYPEEKNDEMNAFLSDLLHKRNGNTEDSEDDGVTTTYDGEQYHQA